MSAFFDLFILVVIAITVFSGYRRGFVQSVMGLASSILAFFAAVYFTPYLGAYICENYLLGAISSEVAETLSSLLRISSGSAISTSQLFGDMPEALSAILERFGTDINAFTSRFSTAMPATDTLVEQMSDYIARPAAEMISSAIAFIVIFIAVSIVLAIVTMIIGMVCELPALKQLNEVMGLVFGVICAAVYAVIFSVVFVHLADVLAVFDPSMFSQNMIDSTYLVKFFSEFRISMLTELLTTYKS